MYLILLLIAACAGFSHWQEITIRAMFQKYGALKGTAAIDSVLASSLSFTEVTAGKIYIDAVRFDAAPTTFINTVHHEIMHTLGWTHFDGHAIMNYTVRLDSRGRVLNDALIVPDW